MAAQGRNWTYSVAYFDRVTVFQLTFNSYSALLVISHYALHRKDSLFVLARRFSVSRKSGTGGGRWGHLTHRRVTCTWSLLGLAMSQLKGGAHTHSIGA